MKALTKEELAVMEEHAPSFLLAVKAVKEGEIDAILMTVDAFGYEPELLVLALRHAQNEGAPVTMAPDSEEATSRH